MELRGYQIDLVAETKNAFKEKFRFPCIVLPCRGGKTAIMGEIAKNAQKKGTPVILIAHRKELIASISLSLCKFGLEHQIIASTEAVAEIKMRQYMSFGRVFYKHDAIVIVASIQTLVNRLDQIKPMPKLMLCDEFHHFVEGSNYEKAFNAFEKPYAVGLTATPCRLDGEGLGIGHGGFADKLLEGPTVQDLMDMNFVAKYRLFGSKHTIDLSSVKKNKKGEFNARDSAQVMDKPHLVGDAVTEWLKVANGLRTVVFCTSISHAEHTMNEFLSAGVKAGLIHGKMKPQERKQVIDDFADLNIVVLCSVETLGEGVDLASIAQKDVHIQCAVNLAPTNSLAWFIQKMSRPLTKDGDNMAIIIDHAMDCERHGLLEMPREWSLEGNKKSKKSDGEKTRAIKKCMQCHCIMDAFHKSCINCGYVFPIQVHEIKQVKGDLVEVDKEAMMYQINIEKKTRRMQQGRCETLQDLLDFARNQGYKSQWAHKLWATRQEQRKKKLNAAFIKKYKRFYYVSSCRYVFIKHAPIFELVA